MGDVIKLGSPGVNVGIIGLGNVGRGVLQVLYDNRDVIEGRMGGLTLNVVAICSRSVKCHPPSEAGYFPDAMRTSNWREVVESPDVDIVAELVGGTGVAAEILDSSIALGKAVVTANKDLMAERGFDFSELAMRTGSFIGMEASVAGVIPIYTALMDGLSGERVTALRGILNGTCNYILTEMERTGDSLEAALRRAQDLGYAEADPGRDIDAYDARAKLALLASLAFSMDIDQGCGIYVEGIRRVRNIDFCYAARLGYSLRLIASAELDSLGGIPDLWVRPVLIPRGSMIAQVEGEMNAIEVKGSHGGETFYSGLGAGGKPTGVAVVGDLIRAARTVSVEDNFQSPPRRQAGRVSAPAEVVVTKSRYYMRFRVRDQIGIIAKLSSILVDSGISVDAVLQHPGFQKEDLPFVMTVEDTYEDKIREAASKMVGLDFLVDEPLVCPIPRWEC